MAILKDTVITGGLRVSDVVSAGGMNAIAVATCTTAAATAAKVITVPDPNWKLQVGSCIAVKYTYTNSASNVTLNVNGSGAKSVYYGTGVNTGSSATLFGYANRYVYYVYDGTYWVWVNHCAELNDNDLVAQTISTTAKWRPLLLAYPELTNSGDAPAATTRGAYIARYASYNPSAEALRINNLFLTDSAKLTYNETDECIDVIFP